MRQKGSAGGSDLEQGTNIRGLGGKRDRELLKEEGGDFTGALLWRDDEGHLPPRKEGCVRANSTGCDGDMQKGGKEENRVRQRRR